MLDTLWQNITSNLQIPASLYLCIIVEVIGSELMAG